MPTGPILPFVLVGGVLFLIAFVLALRTAMFLLRASRTMGTVVGTHVVHSQTHRRRSASYAPRVRYVVDGESFEHVPAISSSGGSYEVGSEMSLLYDRGAPYEARLDGFFYLWFAPTLLGLIGAACLAVAVMVKINS